MKSQKEKIREREIRFKYLQIRYAGACCWLKVRPALYHEVLLLLSLYIEGDVISYATEQRPRSPVYITRQPEIAVYYIKLVKVGLLEVHHQAIMFKACEDQTRQAASKTKWQQFKNISHVHFYVNRLGRKAKW